MRKTIDSEEAFGLWAQLAQTRDVISRARQTELREVGVSISQAGVLYLLKAIEEPVTPAELSRRLLREPQTVFAIVQQMQKQGLVRKTKDLSRKNMVRVVLTEKGEEAYERSRVKRDVPLEVMSCLSHTERANLRAYLRKLRRKGFEILARQRERTPTYRFLQPML